MIIDLNRPGLLDFGRDNNIRKYFYRLWEITIRQEQICERKARKMKMNAYWLFLFVGVSITSCAPQRVVIDYTASEKIFWPGPPEKPRISYLWMVSALSESTAEGIAGFLAGTDTGTSDPVTSTRLLRPYGVFADEMGFLYITDPGAFRVTIIDIKNALSRNILETGEADFLSPIGVVAYKGKIYVSDSLLKKVFIFQSDGKPAGEFQGEFDRPTSLAIDQTRGLIYVSDTLSHQIFIYNLEGIRRGSIGKNGSEKGEFNFPTHLWVDSSGKLYVTDAMNFRIQIFSPEGKHEGMFGMLGDAYSELDKPKGVAVDSDGNIYVVDSIKDTVKIFNREGQLLLFFGEQGRDFGQFWLPSGIFIDSRNQIYVADTYNGRVQAFKYMGGNAVTSPVR